MQSPQNLKVAIAINNDYCSKCSICHSVCPFEAILKDKKTGEATIDVEKCQVCGLCASACPSEAIDLLYCDDDSLVSYTKRLMKQKNSKNLVLTCRGSSPASCEIQRINLLFLLHQSDSVSRMFFISNRRRYSFQTMYKNMRGN